jgi:hypothetical protein
MDMKYVSRAVPLTAEKLAVVERYRDKLQQMMGFKISLSDAIVNAIKRIEELESDIKILSEELEIERQPKVDER